MTLMRHTAESMIERILPVTRLRARGLDVGPEAHRVVLCVFLEGGCPRCSVHGAVLLFLKVLVESKYLTMLVLKTTTIEVLKSSSISRRFARS